MDQLGFIARLSADALVAQRVQCKQVAARKGEGLMASKNNTLQDGFLAALERQAVPATVYLINGVKLQGHVVSHDLFSLAKRRARQTQLVLKSSISTILPNGDFKL